MILTKRAFDRRILFSTVTTALKKKIYYEDFFDEYIVIVSLEIRSPEINV